MRLIDAETPIKKIEILEEAAFVSFMKAESDEEKLFWKLLRKERTAIKHDLMNAPTIDAAPKWIPVSERLPDEETDVLVTRHFLSDKQLQKNAITEAFYVEVATRVDDEWTSYSDEYKIKRHLHKVIAWMPLHEPYKERKNETG